MIPKKQKLKKTKSASPILPYTTPTPQVPPQQLNRVSSGKKASPLLPFLTENLLPQPSSPVPTPPAPPLKTYKLETTSLPPPAPPLPAVITHNLVVYPIVKKKKYI